MRRTNGGNVAISTFKNKVEESKAKGEKLMRTARKNRLLWNS